MSRPRYPHAPDAAISQVDTTNTRPPSDWVIQHLHLIPHDGPVLDLACGSGRHLRALRDAGYAALGVDRNLPVSLNNCAGIVLQKHDLESSPWPFKTDEFAGIVVSNYLHRPLFPSIADSLRPGGLLIYETFAKGNEQYGRPANPDFLLRPGELKAVFGHFEILAFEEVTERGEKPAIRQRIVVRRPSL